MPRLHVVAVANKLPGWALEARDAYLARMPREDLAEQESRRWAEIIELAINLEQAGDIIEQSSTVAGNSLRLSSLAWTVDDPSQALDDARKAAVSAAQAAQERRNALSGQLLRELNAALLEAWRVRPGALTTTGATR